MKIIISVFLSMLLSVSSAAASTWDAAAFDGNCWDQECLPSGAAPVDIGSDITATPIPDTDINFDTITAGGEVTVTQMPNPSPPANFRIPAGASYEITSTATYSGSIQVCLNYSESALADRSNESKLKLFHHDGQSWEDITVPPVDTANNIVCGVTDSLSPFVIGEPVTAAPPTTSTGVPVMNGWWLLAAVGGGAALLRRRKH